MIIVLGQILILLAKHSLRRFQHGVHPLDNVVDDLIVVGFAIGPTAEKLRGDVVGRYCLLEDLDRAEDSVGLGDALLHEVVQLILKGGRRVGRDEELCYFSAQFFGEVKGIHGCVHSVHFALKF